MLKDHYKPETIDTFSDLLIRHLLNKYENKKGILVVLKDNHSDYSGINDKEVLKDSLRNYNSQAGTSAHWFYIKDLQRKEETLCE